MIKINVQGIGDMTKRLSGFGKQTTFATARALTMTAHDANKDIKSELQSKIQGGATPFTLRSFKVQPATKAKPEATVGLRTDAPPGGNRYNAALGHLFAGGGRHWKKLEGFFRAKGILPTGYMIAPGPRVPLDGRGNIRQRALKEMVGILGSSLKNLRVYRKSGRQSHQKGIGFFVSMPGDRSGLTPGIWRRIETNDAKKGSVVELWITFIRPVAYRQQFDLMRIVKTTVDRKFQANFQKAFADAVRTAR